MEVVSAQEVSLANYEVLVFLQEQRHKMSKPGHYHGHKVSGSVATIMLETLTSLESPGRLERQNPEVAKEFLSRIEEFHLTHVEKLALLNLCPESQVEIHLLIENSEERFQNDQLERILDIVREVLLQKAVLIAIS